MNSYAVAAIALFVVGICSILVATLVMYMIIAEVNRHRPDDNQVPYLSFPPRPWKHPENIWIFGEYRRLYPQGRLHVYFFVLGALAFIGLFGALACGSLVAPIPG